MKHNIIEKVIFSIFFTIGIVIFTIGVVVCINVFDYSDKIETFGTISQINTHHSNGNTIHEVYVKYEVDGTQYESKLNGYSSNFYEGKNIKMYYDKNNPEIISTKSLNLLFLMFPGFGLIFGSIGGIGLFVIIKKKRLEQKLRLTGRKVFATYIRTSLNTSYSVNGRHPYNVICEWENPKDNKKYIFKSKNIWVNPESYSEDEILTHVPVYIDDIDNIKNYVVDVDNITSNIVDLT